MSYLVDESGSPINEANPLRIKAIGSATVTHTEVAVAVATTAVLAANANRKYALFVNDSDTIIYLKVGAAGELNKGIRLNASGGSFEMSNALGNLDARAINAIASAGPKNLLVTEGE